jgi:hypothetical protein
MEQCEYHTQLVSDIAVIKSDIVYIKDRVCKHIEEGEEKGGFRDRLVVVELAATSLTKEISALKTAKWISACVGGLVGGLISQVLPETVQLVVRMLFR